MTSAAGERGAIRGYAYQYDHVAAAVYDLYTLGTWFQLRLVDPEAGAVDDCLILLEPAGLIGGEVHAYQYKSTDETVTVATLLAADHNKDGVATPSLMEQLSTGWRLLCTRYPAHRVVIHLVTPGPLSVHDRPATNAAKLIGNPKAPVPKPQHTRAFAASVLNQLASGNPADNEWQLVIDSIAVALGIDNEQTVEFLAALRLEGATPFALPEFRGLATVDTRIKDVVRLADALRRRVAENKGDDAIVFEPEDVSAVAGFGTRGRARHSHRFPVDLDRYTPLVRAQAELSRAVEEVNQGYVALVGPPGSGKSTLLANATPGLADRTVTYLAFMPGDPALAGRSSSVDFLHDIVVRLRAAGIDGQRHLPSADVNELRLEFRGLLKAAGEDFSLSGKRTLLVVDGLDHVARVSNIQSFLSELPLPDALPSGVVIVVGSQSTEPLDARIQQHLKEPQASGIGRMIDLSGHRLTAAAIKDVCRRLVDVMPRLRLSSKHVARVVDLVGGHPLALGYVCNALTGLVESHVLDAREATGDIRPTAVDEALNECVRYSGSVANDYAMYLATGSDEEALSEILGSLARLRPPINMAWVKTWASRPGLVQLKRVKHLFRRYDPMSWAFFHDSFRQFIIEKTSVDALGEPDEQATRRIHAMIAEECARTADFGRERDEEFFHAGQAGEADRALTLATQENLRRRFVEGGSPSLILEDVRRALHLAAELGDSSAMVGLVLTHAELRAREDALESVDVLGLLLDVGLASEAVNYATKDGVLRVPPQFGLVAAVRLDDLGNAGGRTLFDASDVNDFSDISSSDKWEVLDAWSRGVVRFRPLAAVETVLRRLFSQTIAAASADTRGRGEYGVFGEGRYATYIANRALFELWSTGRSSDAERISLLLHEHRDALRALGSSSEWVRRLAGDADDACRADLVQRVKAHVGEGAWDEALSALETDGLEASELPDRPGVNVWFDAHLASQATRIVLALSRLLTDEPDNEHVGRWRALRDAALGQLRRLLARIGQPGAITSNDLSSASDRDDPIEVAVRVRAAHMIVGAFEAVEAGQPVHEEALARALPGIATPPADRPAGGGVAKGAGAHRNRLAIEYAASVDHVVTALATLQAGLALAVLDGATLRNLVNRVLAVLPKVPPGHTEAYRFRPVNTTLLEMLVDIAAMDAGDLLEYVARRIGERTGSLHSRASTLDRSDVDYELNLRQKLGLRLLAQGLRVDWLNDAITETDQALRGLPSAYDRLDALSRQARAHAKAGDIRGAQELAARVIPESFSPHWRKDYQLKEWVEWMLRATSADSSALLSEAADLAPLLAALTDATDGAARQAGEELLRGVVRSAPRQGVRLAAWQLRHGAISFSGMLDAVVSGAVEALIQYADGNPGPIEDAAEVVSLLASGVAAVSSAGASTDMLQNLEELLGQLTPTRASSIKDRIGRAVDTHVLASDRANWRTILSLPETGWSRRDRAIAAAAKAAAARGSGGPSRDWGPSEYGLFKTVDGELLHTDIVRGAVVDLETAKEWLAKQHSPGTFDWAPVLDGIIEGASKTDLESIAVAFDRAYDAAKVNVLLANRMLALGDPGSAARLAAAAVAVSEPSAWSSHHSGAVRRRAWQIAVAVGDEAVRIDAMKDLAQLLTSAEYWPGELMLDLDEILKVVSRDMDATTVWHLVRNYVHAMRVGVTEPPTPALNGAVRGSWWTASSDEDTGSPSEAHRAAANLVISPSADSIAFGLAEITAICLDYPTWAIREGAAAALSCLISGAGPYAGFAAALLLQVLMTGDDRPVLLDGLSGAASPQVSGEDAAESSMDGTASGESMSQVQRTRPIRDTEIGLGGDGLREMAARALMSALGGGSQSMPDMDVRSMAPSWALVDAFRRASGEVPIIPPRPLPASYLLRLPAPRLSRSDPFASGGPYGARLEALARACGLDSSAVAHRFWRLVDIAEKAVPSSDSINSAARNAGVDGRFGAPRGHAIRTSFGRIVYEFFAASRLSVADDSLSELVEMVDLDLVRQPFVPLPNWLPPPIVADWVPPDEWLGDCDERLQIYRRYVDLEPGLIDGDGRGLVLTPSLLTGPAVEFGAVAAVLGARHEFSVADQGRPTEVYVLSSCFSKDASPPTISVAGLLIPPQPERISGQVEVEDWLLSDGLDFFEPTAAPDEFVGRDLIIATDSALLHTNAASWVCLDPTVAHAVGWQSHAIQPLCWVDADGRNMAATVLWRYASADVGRAHHETVGQGSAVVVSAEGLAVLLAVGTIARHQVLTRNVEPDRHDDPPVELSRSATGDLPILTGGR